MRSQPTNTLRHTSPIQGLYRTAVSPYEVGEATVPAGGRVLLLFGAANRDPRKYSDPAHFLVDRNPYKHGRYTPGMHIPIGKPEELYAAQPDLVLILPWNLKTEIMQQLQDVSAWGGKFILPIPEPRIVDAGEVRS